MVQKKGNSKEKLYLIVNEWLIIINFHFVHDILSKSFRTTIKCINQQEVEFTFTDYLEIGIHRLL